MAGYSGHSSAAFYATDWSRLGAVANPGCSLFGAPPNGAELTALGDVRKQAERSPSREASSFFSQIHPSNHTARINCVAWARADKGWMIGLVAPDGNQGLWLKGDRNGILRCACHCGWNDHCPGVVADNGAAASHQPARHEPEPVALHRASTPQRGFWGQLLFGNDAPQAPAITRSSGPHYTSMPADAPNADHLWTAAYGGELGQSAPRVSSSPQLPAPEGVALIPDFSKR